MTREFVELPGFRSDWKELGMTDSDLKRLQHELLMNPEVGAIMQETGGVRKMRFPMSTVEKRKYSCRLY